MIYPSSASLVAKLGEIDALGAARERLARMEQKIKKPDPPRRISRRRKYFLRHPDLYRKLGE